MQTELIGTIDFRQACGCCSSSSSSYPSSSSGGQCCPGVSLPDTITLVAEGYGGCESFEIDLVYSPSFGIWQGTPPGAVFGSWNFGCDEDGLWRLTDTTGDCEPDTVVLSGTCNPLCFTGDLAVCCGSQGGYHLSIGSGCQSSSSSSSGDQCAGWYCCTSTGNVVYLANCAAVEAYQCPGDDCDQSDPSASATVTGTSGPIPLLTAVSLSLSGGVAPWDITIDWGDGNSTNGDETDSYNHSYNTAGMFTITGTACDTCDNCVEISFDHDTVTALPPV